MVDRDRVIAYHEATKHHLHAYAPGPGTLDWATQPDPFRRYAGTETLALDRFPIADGPAYDRALAGRVAPAPLTRDSVSRLLYDGMALSAWKQAGASRWSLRVNPSSGNLHPTECYLIGGPVPDLLTTPAVCHYAPQPHALEVRTRFTPATWDRLCAHLPPDAILIGLTSIYWREAWKYGSRAFRYCQQDAGHAIGAIVLAAAALGWKTRVLDEPGDATLRALLGLPSGDHPEAERPECLLAVYPGTQGFGRGGVDHAAVTAVAAGAWHGSPNALSPAHRPWPAIDDVDVATHKPEGGANSLAPDTDFLEPASIDESVLLRRLIHQRRSAVALDGRSGLKAEGFYAILRRCLPDAARVPFTALPWPASVHLLLFVHRVQDLPPGLYLLVRRAAHRTVLQKKFNPAFEWIRPDACPEDLPMYRLAGGDCRGLAQRVSCHQEIAADGMFAAAMLAEFEPALAARGPWFYRPLHWECGIIGQMLYLEAEAYGVQATGIGCFFDDPVHELVGLGDRSFQDLYHFTVGGGVPDARLTTHPPYPVEN